MVTAYARRFGALSLLAASALAAWGADPITASPSGVIQREIRTANRIGTVPGDHMRIGVLFARPNPFNGDNGSAGTTVTAFAPGSSTPEPINFIFSPASPDEFTSSRFVFDASLADPWRIVIANPESPNSPVTVMTPALRRADGTIPPAMPYVQNMTISGTGTAVTFQWTPPANAFFNLESVRIFDRNRRGPNGGATLIYTKGLPPNTTSHTPPAVLNGAGDTLLPGGQYTAAIQITEQLPSGGQSRSASFFDFSPLDSSSPATVYLPVVGPDNVYQFHVDDLTQRIYIDPEIAIGYEYATGPGDPNFESVLLPNVGDGVFGLQIFDGARWTDGGALNAGAPYSFAAGGVAKFRITGIEPSAGLDPANPNAFVTGLTFVTTGSFTGTMTPLTSIPDITPPVVTPVVSGLLGNGGWYKGPVSVSWNVHDGESAVTSPPCPPQTLTADTAGTTLGCTATSQGGSESASVTIRIDATPPTLKCQAAPALIWPPNDQMVDVAVNVVAADALSGVAGFVLASIDGSDGAIASDMSNWVLGTPDTLGRVRASRSGSGPGRTYAIRYVASDAAGNTASCVASIVVPHDKGR